MSDAFFIQDPEKPRIVSADGSVFIYGNDTGIDVVAKYRGEPLLAINMDELHDARIQNIVDYTLKYRVNALDDYFQSRFTRNYTLNLLMGLYHDEPSRHEDIPLFANLPPDMPQGKEAPLIKRINARMSSPTACRQLMEETFSYVDKDGNGQKGMTDYLARESGDAKLKTNADVSAFCLEKAMTGDFAQTFGWGQDGRLSDAVFKVRDMYLREPGPKEKTDAQERRIALKSLMEKSLKEGMKIFLGKSKSIRDFPRSEKIKPLVYKYKSSIKPILDKLRTEHYSAFESVPEEQRVLALNRGVITYLSQLQTENQSRDSDYVTLAFNARHKTALMFNPNIPEDHLPRLVREEYDHYCVNAVGVDIAFQDKMANYPEEHPQELKLLEGGIRDYKHYEPHEYAIELLFAVKEYAKERETEIRAAHPGLDPKAISQMLDSQMTESFGELWAKRKEVDFEIQAEAFASLAKRKGAMAARAFAQRVGFEPVVGAWSEAADTEQEGVKRNI